MKILFYLVIFLNLSINKAFSTSTSFDQNTIFNVDKLNNSKLNKKLIIGNFQSFALTGSLGIIGNQLYEKGFFSPFGFIPENIVSLSPVVYENEPKKERVFQTYQKCFPLKNNYNNFKKSYFKDYFNECSLNKKVDDNLLSNQLIKRYYK